MFGVSSPSETVGIEDFVLLENYQDPEAFLDNLRVRYDAKLIYTYIGPVLISINPYKDLNIYSEEYMHKYKNSLFYELPPHIYAIANNSYNNMMQDNRDECILVSGESGAGKTEATKYIIEFIAEISVHSETLTQIKETLIKSNQVLEAFGNAKTMRNDNSSRFGKYMDIQFDFSGAPDGGHISNYLLEKSRVIYQGENERNFHIFYQILAGADDSMLEQLGLVRDLNAYHYLTDPSSTDAEEQGEDRVKFGLMFDALQVCNINDEKRMDLLRIISAILHLGNIKFVNLDIETKPNEPSYKISEDQGTKESLEKFSQLLSLSKEDIEKALVNRKFHVAAVEDVESPLNVEQANYARDSFAKSIYQRVFDWIIKMTNVALNVFKNKKKAPKLARKSCCLGILDIYGFEIFEKNSFEQFCINYCNEKLHQLFIELTLKSEQEEYQREEIDWQPITYFDNKPICSLIESKPLGIIDILDEECAIPGKVDDKTLLSKLSNRFLKHPNFECSDTAKNKWKTLAHSFAIKHYAGFVIYSVSGFIDKNKNDLYRNFYELMLTSKNPIIQDIYIPAELKATTKNKTVGSQFRGGLKNLLTTLYSKESSYIRCIKPNMDKAPRSFNDKEIRIQIDYLSLMDNLNVRRAGYAYKRIYEKFLKRYKCICPSTWPKFTGEPRLGVAEILNHQELVESEDYAFGKTKIFIRMAKTCFKFESDLLARKHELITMINAMVRGYLQWKKYQRIRKAIITIQRAVFRWNARKKLKILLEKQKILLEKKKQEFAAGQVIRAFINGFIHRNEPYGEINQVYLRMMYEKFLLRLANNLDSVFCPHNWPEATPATAEASDHLEKIHKNYLARIYRQNLTEDRKSILTEKMLASDMFKDKKESYSETVAIPFQVDRLAENPMYMDLSVSRKAAIAKKKLVPNEVEVLKYMTIGDKFNRRGYKQCPRIFVLTQMRLYGYNFGNLKCRDQIDFDKITGISVTKFSDGFLVIHILKLNEDEEYIGDYTKGDLIIRCEKNSIEFITKLCDNINPGNKKPGFFRIVDKNLEDYFIRHRLADGRTKKIQFKRSQSDNTLDKSSKAIMKDKKNGRLIVEV